LGGAGGGGNGGAVVTGASILGTSGFANTGGGGGDDLVTFPRGGSGIVVIRYPSYLAPATSTTGSPQTYIAGSWRVYVWVSSGTITF
jgi:hypothetical protein